MEKTNELNKFLSYIHMGMSVYRVYHEHAEKMDDEQLLNEIVKVEEIFKKHEESITKEINELGEDATESLTLAGIMGVYKEKMMIVDDAFSICLNAIKATNMGMLSALKFLEDNNKLEPRIRKLIVNVINDYERIQGIWVNYILENICK